MEPLLALLREHLITAVVLAALIDGTALPFPGRVLLVLAGTFAGRTELGLLGVIVAGAVGALAGDHLWYVAGRWKGPRLLAMYCRALPRARHCTDRARRYIARFGALVFVIGRFVAGVRVLAAPIAYTAGIGYAKFLAFDVVGALLWSATFTGAGYALGARAPELLGRVGLGGQIAIGVAVTALGLGAATLLRRFSRSPRGAPRPARDRRRRRAA